MTIEDLKNHPVSAIEHHGVLGMKWGVRRSQATLDRLSGRSRSRASDSEDYSRSRELKKKNLRTLSNSELKALNERLNLESNYSKLTKGASLQSRLKSTFKTANAIYNSPIGKALTEQVKNELTKKK